MLIAIFSAFALNIEFAETPPAMAILLTPVCFTVVDSFFISISVIASEILADI